MCLEDILKLITTPGCRVGDWKKEMQELLTVKAVEINSQPKPKERKEKNKTLRIPTFFMAL